MSALAHWHAPNPLGSDQFCAACDAVTDCRHCGEAHAASSCAWTPSCADCGHPTGALESDVCEECTASRVRVAAREAKYAAWESRGDQMRDERKGEI